MTRKMIQFGGFINLFFTLFHIFLGYVILNSRNIDYQNRVLMFMLNTAGTIFIAFFAYISIFKSREIMKSYLGKSILILLIMTYLVRAIEEIYFFGTSMNLPIFISCLLIALLYSVILFRIQKTGLNESREG